MTYDFQFSVIMRDWELLALGAWLTIRMSAMAMVLGLVFATAFAWAKTNGPRWLWLMVTIYVEVVRNTPLLIQLFLIFLGLPAIGISLTPNQAALTALVVNMVAYGTEIVRAGIESVPRGHIEAGRSLGFTRYGVFRHIVLFQAMRAIYPALCSQFILVLLGSSVVSVISATDLSATANFIQSRNFRSFEVYFVVTLMYLVIALAFRFGFRVIQHLVFDRRGFAGTGAAG